MVKVGDNFKLEKLYDDVKVPQYVHDGDSGMDVYSRDNVMLHPQQRHLFPLGFKISIPKGFEVQVRPKSGLALKKGITILNSPGTIDAGYRGECGAILVNNSDSAVKISEGDKIAQIVVCPVTILEEGWEVVDSLDDTSRGEGGFGSTGER